MRNCWSSGFILGATLAGAGFLTVGCGKAASDDASTGDSGVGGEAAGGAEGGAGGAGGGAVTGGTGGDAPLGGEPTGGTGGTGGSGGALVPTGECGPDVQVVDLSAEGDAGATTYSYSGTTGAEDVFFASCTPPEEAGSEGVLKFTASVAGYWRFTTTGTVWDSVLYALEDCNDGFTEVACNNDVGGGDTSSALLLEMTEGQTVYLFVDQIGKTRESAYTVTAEKIDANPPVVTEFRAYYSDVTGVAGVRVTGTDADMDITQFRWGVFGADGMQIPLDQASPELQSSFEEFTPFVLTHNEDGSYSVEGVAAPQGGFPLISKMTFALGDANGLFSDFAEADVAPTDVVRAHGEACDGGRALDACVETDACADEEGDGTAICVTANPPVITASEAFYNATENSFALHLTGTDPENNLNFVRFTGYNAGGDEVFFGDQPGTLAAGLYRAQQAEGNFDALVVFNGTFSGLCLPGAQAHFDECAGNMRPEEVCIEEANAILDMCNRETAATITRFNVIAVDATLKETAAFDIEIAATPVHEAGGTCDVLYASGTCPEGSACANLAGGDAWDTCESPELTACPEAFGAIDLTADDMESPWTARGDNAMAESHGGFGSCGGGGPNLVYTFTAAAAGNYNVSTSRLGENVDSLMWVRTACAFYGEDYEVGCNDDIDTQGGDYASSVDFMAEAGQAFYIFVDSYNGQFPGSFTVTVTGP